jgi:hypothetical protein
MAEPFPDIPGCLVWGIIVFVILIGTVCLATLIAGICTGKWWLMSLGVAFCGLYYLKVPASLAMRYHLLERHDIITSPSGLGKISSRIFSEEFQPSIEIIG